MAIDEKRIKNILDLSGSNAPHAIMTDWQRLALQCVAATCDLTCTEIGEKLWPGAAGSRQSLARPAGRLLVILKDGGYCSDLIRNDRRIWVLTTKGQLELNKRHIFGGTSSV